MQEHYERYWNREAPPPLDDPLAETRASMLFDYIGQLSPSPHRFLDIGCGDGWLVSRAAKKGMNAVGLDISPSAVERARTQFPEARFDVAEIGSSSLPVAASSFDVATSFEVIEHLMDPAALITAMHEALRSGGFAAITTPYHGLVKNVAIAVRGFDTHYSVTGDHIRFFSDRALRRVLEENGFQVIAIKHFGRAPLIWAGTFVWARKK